MIPEDAGESHGRRPEALPLILDHAGKATDPDARRKLFFVHS